LSRQGAEGQADGLWSEAREVEGEELVLLSLKGEALEELLGLTVNRYAHLKAHRLALTHPRPELKRGALRGDEIKTPRGGGRREEGAPALLIGEHLASPLNGGCVWGAFRRELNSADRPCGAPPP
jgi:hypothetical protein